MTNTLTHTTTSTGDVVTYANNEAAFLGDDRVFSFPAHSTAIRFWSYAPAKKQLVVQYVNGHTHYVYEDVPFRAVFALMSAPSLGKYIATEIKPHYSVA